MRFFSEIQRLPLGGHVFFAIVLLTISFGIAKSLINVSTPSPDVRATLTQCFAEVDNNAVHAETCTRDAIRKFLSIYSTAELMEFTSADALPVSIRGQCHALGHIIGEETYKQTGSLENALARCTNSCRSACLHGAISQGVLETLGGGYEGEDIAHADTGALIKMGSPYCDRSIPLCHGLGHVAYMTAASLQSALTICDDISKKTLTAESCYQGVFMERSGTADAATPFNDVISYEIREGDYTYPCLDIDPKYRRACFQELPAYLLPLFEKDGVYVFRERLEKVIETCNTIEGRDRASCFEGIGVEAHLFGYFSFDGDVLQALCDRLPRTSDQTACTLGIVPKYAFIDSYATSYCDAIDEEERRTTCYHALFQWTEFTPGVCYTSERGRGCVCEDSPQCATAYETYLSIEDSIPDYRFGLYGELE